MLSTNYTKFLLFAVVAISHFSACRFWQTAGETTKSLTEENQPKRITPFSTKEPPVYQAEVITATYLNGQRFERKYFVAKRFGKNYIAFNVEDDNETAILERGDGKTFILNKKKKSYIERAEGYSSIERDELRSFLTTKWLNEKREAKFENLGNEKNLAKFRVTIDDSHKTEVLIFVNEKLNLPIRQEFYSISEGKRNLSYSIEVKNVRTQVSEKLFKLPDGYQSKTVDD